jgi:hypothetical protein
MAAAFDRWMKASVQPAAKELLGAPIVRVEVMSSYSCRAAYGRKHNRMSEHARANALDIKAFLTDRAGGVDLLADWGATDRDIRAHAAAAAKAAEAKAEAIKRAAEKAAAQPAPQAAEAPRAAPRPAGTETAAPAEGGLRGTVSDQDGQSGLASGVKRWRSGNGGAPAFSLTPPSQLGGPKDKDKTAPSPAAPAGATSAAKPSPSSTPKARFLRSLHASACKTFGTVLGPEANEAHRNHFHIDMAERRSGSYCE